MKLLIFLLIGMFAWSAQAEYQRKVHVEWEAIEGAKFYDVEWLKVPVIDGAQPISVQVSEPQWTGLMAPGVYQMRIRARDKRKAPGDWSATEEFKVGLDPVTTQSPAENANHKSRRADKEPVSFKWQAVPGAQKYTFELKTENGSVQETREVSGTELTLPLPVAQKYNWSVKAIATDAIQSEKSTVHHLTLLGPTLESPVFAEADAVGSLKWSKPAYVESFDYILLRQNSQTGKWETVETVRDFAKTELPFSKDWIGGTYAIQMKAKAPLREVSEKVEAKFRIEDVNQRPAIEEAFVLRKSWERRHGIFAWAQQQVGEVDYSSTNLDRSQNAHFSTLGGNARLGVGVFDDSWLGGVFTIESGGLYIDGRTYSSSTYELTAINRETTEDGESRHYFGAFAKELPLLSSQNTSNYEVDKVSSAGVHYGYEQNWILGTRTGAQASFHGYLNVFKLRTPNDQDLAPSLSFQLAVLGTYKLTPTALGGYGYTYRLDSIAYGSPTAFNANNKVQISGHSLNFFLEWAL